MFVMLPVRTATTVRERQANPISKSKVYNQLDNSITSLSANSLLFRENNSLNSSSKQSLNLYLNNLKIKNSSNNKKLFCIDCKTIGNKKICIDIAIDDTVDSNTTQNLIPSKLSAKSSTVPTKILLTQQNNYKVPSTEQVDINVNHYSMNLVITNYFKYFQGSSKNHFE